MFNSLKNKLKTWLGKSEERKEKPEKIAETQKKEEIEKKKLSSDTTAFDLKSIKKTAEKVELTSELPQAEEKQEETQEDIKEEIQEKKSFFSKIKSKISSTELKIEHLDKIFEDLEIILLENNVALEVVDKIKAGLYSDLIGKQVKKNTIREIVVNALKKSISEVLFEPPNLIEKIKSSKTPFIIIFFGINGSGKTTSLAKLAYKLKENDISCVFAAADTFRAASIEQLETHAKNLNIPIIKQTYGSDPTAVAFDAKKYAENHNIKCVLIDTAGRMYTKENLIKQMEKIIRVIKPNLKIFVGESIAGNDAVSQSKTFNEAVGIDGIILAKSDVDEKGGTILSVSYITKAPIYYLGTGQNYENLQLFKKENVLKNLGLE